MYTKKSILILSALVCAISGLLVAGCDTDCDSDFNHAASDNILGIHSQCDVSAYSNLKIASATEKIYDLPNGFSVRSSMRAIDQKNFYLDINYATAENGEAFRQLIISRDFMGANIYAGDGQFLYGYEISVTDDQQTVTFSHRTQQDSFGWVISDAGLSQQFSLNGKDYALIYRDQQEMDRGNEVLQNPDLLLSTNLTKEESALYSKIAGIREVMKVPNTLLDNPDAEIAVYLMAHEPFLEDMVTKTGITVSTIGEDICAASSLIATVSCPFFLTGWAAVACVPSLGISIVCSVGQLAGADI